MEFYEEFTDIENFIQNFAIDAVTDIHLINYGECGKIYVRENGKYLYKAKIKQNNFQILFQQLKVKSGLDISEKRLPQDGVLNISNKQIRVSTVKTVKGEAAVLRLFNKKPEGIEKLGFKEEQLSKILNTISQRFTLILISGGTGSGKSTTLKAILKSLSERNLKIISIEDPVEISIEDVVEININEASGLNYEKAIFSSMRQDPDIISIGEIRDKETASALLKASLSGHSVISTIHSGDYKMTLSRLESLIPSPFFKEILDMVINQRLIENDGEVNLNANVFIKNKENIEVI